MKIVFGLGNPGTNYAKTRHNTGFMALDTFAAEHTGEFADKPKFHAFIAELQINGEKVLLVKPQTFYNDAGRSYRAVIDFYKAAPADTLIIHDELALPFGTIRIRQGGSDAGNNGIKSINQYGGSESLRLRVGIANEQRMIIGDTDFVLANYSQEECSVLKAKILPMLNAKTQEFIIDGLASVSHKLDLQS